MSNDVREHWVAIEFSYIKSAMYFVNKISEALNNHKQ